MTSCSTVCHEAGQALVCCHQAAHASGSVAPFIWLRCCLIRQTCGSFVEPAPALLISRRKSRQVEAALQELGMEGLEERLSSATQNPASPAYRLSRLVSIGHTETASDVTSQFFAVLRSSGKVEAIAVLAYQNVRHSMLLGTYSTVSEN